MPFPRQVSFNLPIGAAPPDLGGPEMYAELTKLYNAVNLLATLLDQYTGNTPTVVADRSLEGIGNTVLLQNSCKVYAKAGVNLVLGELVTFSVVSGALTANKAQANGTHNLKCQGMVTETVTAGGWVPVVLKGLVTAYAGLTPGAYYYLSTVAGALGAATPAAGNTLQYIGFALDATHFILDPELRHSVA